MTSYEAAIARIAGMPTSDSPTERDIAWMTGASVVGVSRAHDGRLEIFLSGPRLEPGSSLVKDAVEFQKWHRRGGAPSLDANRLLLPAIGHFDQVAAFICIELLRSGADADLAAAFRRTEPIIELAIRRLRLSDQAFVGLAGELLLLEALCRRANDDQVALVVDGWDGWQESLRDFTCGDVGVEVKTTTRSTSSHQIQGTHQVEPNDGEDGGAREYGLFLVSIGIQTTFPHDDAFTMPSLVERIIDRLRAVNRGDLAGRFLAHVCEYGSVSGFGYDHATMSNDAVFARPFAVSFVRAYDMTDTSVEVIRRSDVVPHHHVDPRSLTYRIELPVSVTGDLNPIVGIHQAAGEILGAALP